ncbi:MAG: BCAM0308 family protein [Elusimicrobia bacterium]|nr:BCAM0308 family protein [Elusimicrobiota bacterium]
MRANVAVRARSSREIRDRIADPYKRTSKHPQPVVCSGCGALFSRGRWRWTPRPPQRAARELCQACRRVKDAYPAGVVTLRGAYLREHADEIIGLARHEEKAEMADHPMHRIMAVERGRDRLVIKTTDIHLPGRIGRAVARACKGELDLKYAKDAYFVRVGWSRD